MDPVIDCATSNPRLEALVGELLQIESEASTSALEKEAYLKRRRDLERELLGLIDTIVSQKTFKGERR